MPIVPDTKNWTWVTERRCPECGLYAPGLPREAVPTLIRINAAAWQEVLAEDDVAERPAENVWSPLEYGCHVRDVLRIFDERLQLMLGSDDPEFENWDQDATAIAGDYPSQDPPTVIEDLLAGAEQIAARFETVSGDQWQRPARRSDGATFTVESFARYLVHDPVHHLYDVTGVPLTAPDEPDTDQSAG
jgi:DinB superfamily